LSQIADNSSDEEVAYPHAPPAPWMIGRRVLAVMVGIAVSGTAVVAVVRGSSTKSIRAKTDRADAISQLSEEDPCDGYPQIKLSEEPLHKNFGNKGPDEGDEGLVYEGTNIHPGKPEQEVLVVVNSTGPAAIDISTYGMNGDYALLDAKGGTFVHAKFSILDKNRKPITVPELDVTFFDLDKHTSGNEVEFVKIKKPDAHFLTKDTLIDVSEGTDGYVTFKATKEGTGADNPENPLMLTTEQKNKAVTVKYINTGNFEAELGSTGKGANYRGFLFVFRPSLLCAKTTDGEDPVIEEEKKATTTTTTLPETTTTTVEEKQCWFTIPIINFCFPKLF